MTAMHMPPILRGTTLVGIERYKHNTVFVFVTTDKDVRGDGYVRVKVLAQGAPKFIYTMYDEGTNTIRHFEGDTGDPEKDSYEIVSGDSAPE